VIEPGTAATPPRTAIRRVSLARGISFTGGTAAFMALTFEIYRITRSPGWLAATLFLTFGVVGLAGPVAGTIGDRFDRRTVMIVSDLAGAALFAVMAFVHTPGALVAVAFCAALAEAPFGAASGAAIPNLVGDESQLGWANGLVSLGENAGHIGGPLMGGLLIWAFDAQAAFLANAVSFVISAALVATVRGRFREIDTGEGDGNEHRGVAAGFRFLFHERILRTIAFAWVAIVLGGSIAIVADVPLTALFGVGSTGYGVMIACWGGGSIVGSLAGRWVNERNEPTVLVVGAIACAVGTFAVAVSPVFWPVAAAMVLAGSGEAYLTVAEQSVFQRRTPDAVRSRVMAAQEALVSVSMAAALGAAGFVVVGVGVRGAYVVGGVTALVATVMLVPVRRSMSRERRESAGTAAPTTATGERDRVATGPERPSL
jgi:MFS family permease